MRFNRVSDGGTAIGPDSHVMETASLDFDFSLMIFGYFYPDPRRSSEHWALTACLKCARFRSPDT